MAIKKAFLAISDACERKYGSPLPRHVVTLGNNKESWYVSYNSQDFSKVYFSGLILRPYMSLVSRDGKGSWAVSPYRSDLDAELEAEFIEWLESLTEKGEK